MAETATLSELWDNPDWIYYSDDVTDDSGSEDFKPKSKNKNTKGKGKAQDTSSEEEEEEDDDDEFSDFEDNDSDQDIVDPSVKQLDAFVNSLSKKDKESQDLENDQDESGQDRKRKRTILSEKTDLRPENEYGSLSTGNSSKKLRFEDLISTLPTDQKSAARKTLKPLAPSTPKEQKDDSKGKESNKKEESIFKQSGPLNAPLPNVLQAKINREAAGKVLNEEVEKWDETVRQMKGISRIGEDPGEHRLTLPLRSENDKGTNNEQLTSKYAPSSSLEKSIQSILTSAKLTGKDNKKAEDEALKAAPPGEDQKQRILELRRHRELMYRSERKAKRMAKIKSKTYRRLMRHTKAKKDAAEGHGDLLSLEEMVELDELDGGNRVQEALEKAEMQRVKERATLKHASKRGGGGKWAQAMAGMIGQDDEAGLALRDRAEREAQLRQKITMTGDDDDSNESSDDDDEDDDSEFDQDGNPLDSTKIKQNAFDEIQQVLREEREQEEENGAENGKKSGLMNMAFMQRGAQNQRKKLQEEAQDFERELEEQFKNSDNEDSDSDKQDKKKMLTHQSVQGNVGRRVIAPKTKGQQSIDKQMQAINEKLESDSGSNSEGPTPKSSTSKSKGKSAAPRRYTDVDTTTTAATTPSFEANPWLNTTEKASKNAKKEAQIQLVGGGKDGHKVVSKISKRKANSEEARQAAKDDAQVNIDVNKIMTLEDKSTEQSATTKTETSITKAGTKSKKGKQKAQSTKPTESSFKSVPSAVVANAGSDDDTDDDDEDQVPAHVNTKNQRVTMTQRDLVAKAFANDNVVEDFEREKQETIARDAPREEDTTLPGWGSWGGKGVKKQKNAKKFTKKIAGVETSKRKDAKLNNVIISERSDKKTKKYLVNDLPYPYTSTAQHEHKLRRPMGQEWSTSSVHRNNTTPSVLIKPGTAIQPVDRYV